MSEAAQLGQVTIGMPVYNASRYVTEAIDSVFAQTVTDWRLVICDNGSTDDTVEVVKRYESDPRVSVVTSDTNRGLVYNFRRAFTEADTAFYMWLSDDDLLHPTYLERCLERLGQQRELIGVYTEASEIDQDGAQTGSFVDGPHPEHRIDANPAVRLREAITAEPALSFFGVYHTETLRRTDQLAPYVGSDRTLAGHLAMLGPILQVPEELFVRRTHPSSYSHAEFSNRRKFTSYSGFSPQWYRPIGVERIYRLAGLVHRSDLSIGDALRCHRVIFTTFAWLTVKTQLIMSLRFTSHWVSRATGRDVQLHRLLVAGAKRAGKVARLSGAKSP